ncbi:unnamed protein product [Closterium sp. Yama58-4]|nr:unnamed protein product [Closterium sp. Yama58-4]
MLSFRLVLEEVEAGGSLGTQTSAASSERQRGEKDMGGAGERTYFEEVVRALVGDLKTRIISRESDLMSIAFFNTRAKQNVQSAEGVFVFQDNQQTSAQLIRDLSNLPGTLLHRFKSYPLNTSPVPIPASSMWTVHALRYTPASRFTPLFLILSAPIFVQKTTPHIPSVTLMFSTFTPKED